MLGIRQPQLVLKVSQVPDWGRRAIRLSLALTFFTTIAIWLWPVPGEGVRTAELLLLEVPCSGVCVDMPSRRVCQWH